ncbi:MAG: hypothetical protein WD768_16980 [Phycisphaeraceae bacterium]
MSNRKKLHAAIDAMDEIAVEAVLAVVKQVTCEKPVESSGLWDKLERIRIQGPADLGEQHDRYARGDDAE